MEVFVGFFRFGAFFTLQDQAFTCNRNIEVFLQNAGDFGGNLDGVVRFSYIHSWHKVSLSWRKI